MSIPAAMYPLLMTGATASLQTSFVGTPTITTFSNGLLGVTGPTSIFGHLNLPVYDSVALWLDAADSATIGLSATRGAGGYSQVSAWYDKSSNAQHLFQATAANQPYYHPTGFNGRPGVRFGYNSAGTSLARTGPFVSGTGQITMFLVHRFEGLNNQRIISAVGTGNTDVAADAFGFKNSPIGIQYTRGGTFFSPSIVENYQYMCLSFLQNPSSNTVGGIGPSNAAYFFNGVASTTFQSSLFTSNFNASNFTLFNGSPGFVAELIIYRRTLLAPERQSMESYLINKWGIATATIPVPAQQGFGANLALWLDAADNDMLTFSNNGQNVVPTVSAWFDKSGNNQHTRQATLARQPYYEATGFNGLPGLRFGYNSTAFPGDYTAQGLATNAGTGFIGGNSPAIAASPSFTMFFVLKNEGQSIRFIQTNGVIVQSTSFGPGSFDSFAVTLGCTNNAATSRVQGVRYGGLPNYIDSNIGSNNLSFKEILITSMANATSIAAGGLSSNTVGFFLNGALVTSNINPVNILSNLNCLNLVIGQTTHDVNGTWQGYFAEFIVYNTVLSISQRQAVETYLSNKWNLGTTTVPVPTQFGNRAPLRNLGPCLWLDANDTATVLRSTGPNAGMGNAYVQTWFDKSGREFYVTQSNAANRPYYDATGFNGRPTIRFGATGATLLNTVSNVFFGSSNFLGTGDILNEMTMFAVMRMDVDLQVTGRMLSAAGAFSGLDSVFNSGSNGVGRDGFLFYYQQNTGVFGQAKYGQNIPLNLGSNFMLSFVANSNSSNIGGVASNSFQNFINGFPSQSGGLTGNAASNFSTLALGIGASAALGSPARFALSELIIYGRSLLGSERSNVESYLTSKWAITSASQAAPFQVGTTAQPLYRSLATWYDAADVATVGLLNSSNLVTNWYDKTGRGFTVNQATANNCPYYNPTGYSGLPTIEFSEGLGTGLRTPSANFTPLTGQNGLTYFIVMKPQATAISFPRIFALFDGLTGPGASPNDSGGCNMNLRINPGTFNNTTQQFQIVSEGIPGMNNTVSGIIGSNILLSVTINNQSSNYGGLNINTAGMYLNGLLLGTNSNATRSNIATGTLYIGGGYGGSPYTHAMSEFIMYNSTLSTVDRQNIEKYLMTKWSVSTFTTAANPIPAPNRILFGLNTWLDASDTSLIRRSGSNVTVLADKSLLGQSALNVTVGTGGTFPIFSSNTWTTTTGSNRQTLSFIPSLRSFISGRIGATPMTNNTGWVAFNTSLISSSLGMSFFQVGSLNTTTGSAGRLFSALDCNFTGLTNEFSRCNIGGFAVYTGPTTGNISVARGSANANSLLTTTTPVGCNVNFQLTLMINASATASNGIPASNSMYVINTAAASNFYSNTLAFFATSTINISTIALGGSALTGVATATDIFGGNIGEVIAYNRVVTAAERQSIEEYLRRKWF